MHVQKIEFVEFRHFGHARSQSEIVRWVVEEWVAGDFDFVVMDVRLRFGKSNGLRVRDEVHVVPALCQLQTKFRGHYPAATVGGIAGDPDLHSASPETSRFDGRKALAIQILRCFVSGGRPMNSTPFPTPGSLVRTTAEVEILSDSIQKSTRNIVPTASGRIDST